MARETGASRVPEDSKAAATLSRAASRRTHLRRRGVGRKLLFEQLGAGSLENRAPSCQHVGPFSRLTRARVRWDTLPCGSGHFGRSDTRGKRFLPRRKKMASRLLLSDRGLIQVSSRKSKVWLLFAASALLFQQGLLAQSTATVEYREELPFDLQTGLGAIGDWKAVVTATVEPHGEIVSDERPSQSRICFLRTAPRTSECAYFKD
jgi:hypothetical protein